MSDIVSPFDVPPLHLEPVALAPASTSVEWPPAPHDPRERVLIFELLAQSSMIAPRAAHGSSGRGAARTTRWEVRAFPLAGRMHRYFAPRGLLHLQLWQPESGVSVLTPSRLTLGRWEVFPVEGWKHAADRVEALRRAVRRAHGVELPSVAQLRAVQAWFVGREERRAQATSPPA